MKNKEKKLRISFTGDILCDYPELKYMKKNHYNFDQIFSDIDLKSDNELLIGNLETPICPLLPYTFESFSFNSPVKFIKSLSKLGFDLVSVANNHCLDRGKIGAKSTIKYLKKNNIISSGIYYKSEKNYDVIEKNNIKIAFVSYTYGTNYNHNHYYLKENDDLKLNLLKQQNGKNEVPYSLSNYMYTFIKSYIKNTRLWKFLAKVKHKLKKENVISKKALIIDNIDKNEWMIEKKYLNHIEDTIKKAKNEAGMVVLLLHSGGQFNGEVGTFTKEIVNNITKMPVDLIIGNHPHIVQRFEFVNSKPVFYSLGNFVFSPCSEYVNFEYKPDYSVKANCYIDDNKNLTFGFEILKTVTNQQNNHSSVMNTYNLYNKLNDNEKKKLVADCNFIINRLYDTCDIEYINVLQREYKLEKEV